MSWNYHRLLQDWLTTAVAFALPNAASGKTTSAAINLGAPPIPEALELEVSTPALSATIIPDTKTVTLGFEASNDPTFATGVVDGGYRIYTGASAAGVAAQSLSIRPALDYQYWRAYVTLGANTTDASALNATPTVRV
jgi:hypothetical protein